MEKSRARRYLVLAAVSATSGLAAYYALRLHTEIWLHGLRADGTGWLAPSWTSQMVVLYTLYAILGVTGHLWSKSALSVAIPGLLGFTYGLPSSGGKWAWSDTMCCGDPLSQAAFLLADFQAMPWRFVAELHGAITLCIFAGWWLAHAAITAVDSLRRRAS
jgi:hypothetical protein